MRSLHHIEVDRGEGVASFHTAVDYLAPGRGGRDLPRGDDLAGDGAQGVQDRSRTHRGGGRRTARARHPVGHPADDDQGPPARLLPRARRSRSRVGEPMHPTGDDPVAETAELQAPDGRDAATRRSPPTPPTSSRPGSWWVPASMGGSAPTLEEAAAPRRRGEARARPQARREAGEEDKATGRYVDLSTGRFVALSTCRLLCVGVPASAGTPATGRRLQPPPGVGLAHPVRRRRGAARLRSGGRRGCAGP